VKDPVKDWRLRFRNSCPTLLHELYTARRLARASASAPFLRTAGLIDLLALPEYPPWGIEWVSAGEEFFQPDRYGTPALILPAIENFSVIDLVAVSFDTGAVRTRYGIAEYLGFNESDNRALDGEAVPVFEDAASWLRGGGDGIFIVDWTQIVMHLRSLPALVCQTAALAERIKRAFEQAIPCPPLLVSSDARETPHAA
jgi:hypothetical protein